MKNRPFVLLLTMVSSCPAFSQTAISWQQPLVADKLNESDLRGFESRGVQKLEDLAGFLAIIGNGNYDPKLREKAKEQAAELFADPDCRILESTQRDYFGNHLYGVTGGFSGMQSVSVKRPFVWIEETAEYHALLSFQIAGNKEMTAELVALKTRKKFGTEELEVWTVYLCEIKELD